MSVYFVAEPQRTTSMMTLLKYNASTMKNCYACKTEKELSCFSKDTRQKNGYRSACKACSSKQFAKFKNSPAYARRLQAVIQKNKAEKKESPVVRWASMAIAAARQRAKKKNLPCTITKEWLISNAVTYCPLLEVPLDYAATVSSATSASVDRIDSTQGYTPANCKVISFQANRIKSNATHEEIARLAANMQSY